MEDYFNEWEPIPQPDDDPEADIYAVFEPNN